MVSENLKIAVVLRGLSDDYKDFIAAAQFQELNYRQLKEKVIERTHSMTNTPENREVAAAKFVKGKAKCKHCGKTNHSSEKCFKVNKCKNCGKNNHASENCHAPGGPKHRSQEKHESTAGIAKCNLTQQKKSSTIYVDSGCTSHILNSEAYFESMEDPKEPMKIMNGDGSVQMVEAIGTAIIPFQSADGKEGRLVLSDVLYAPQFVLNLISVKKLATKVARVSLKTQSHKSNSRTQH